MCAYMVLVHSVFCDDAPAYIDAEVHLSTFCSQPASSADFKLPARQGVRQLEPNQKPCRILVWDWAHRLVHTAAASVRL